MLDPEYKRHVAEGCERIGSLLHEEIIKIIAEGIVTRMERGVDYRLTARDKWMLETLQAAGYLREDLEKEIAARTKVMLTEIRDAFQDAAVRNLAWDDAVYAAAGLEPPPLRQSPYLLRLARRGYEKTCGEWLNFTGTLADAAQQLYIRECDRAYTLAASGAMSQTQAVRQAVETAAREGVTVKYTRQREDGTRYVYHTDTIETAVTRAVRTGIGQACGEMTLARMEEMDWDIILVSAHLGARTGDGGDNFTNHFWLQGKFYSRDGSDRRFPPFSVCNVGHVQGLLGANCRRSVGPGDGRFIPDELQIDSEANRIRYEQEQKQRRLERDIRKTKREVQGLKKAMDAAEDQADKAELKAAYQKKALKLRDQNQGYKAYCEETGLKTQDERLHVAGWDRKQAASAAGAARSAEKVNSLAKNENRGIMRNSGGYAEQEGNAPVIPERYKDDFSDFEALSLDQREREILTALHERTTTTGFEYGQVRTKSGFSEVFTSRKNNWVSIPDVIKKQDGLSLYHGHTNVTTFSAQDLRLLTQENVDKVSVVTSDRSVFSVQIGGGWRPTLEEFNGAVDSIETATDQALMDHEDFFSWSVQERNYMAIRERAYRIARYFGWRLEGGKL